MKATPFKIAEVIDANTPISTETKKIIEQNNFVNNSLHIIGQQLDRIEEKAIEKVEQMLFDLQKIKTEQCTSTNTAHAISRKKRERDYFL